MTEIIHRMCSDCHQEVDSSLVLYNDHLCAILVNGIMWGVHHLYNDGRDPDVCLTCFIKSHV